MYLRAYAKINLGLRILARRPDGYHDIETIFHQINLYDEIELTQSEGGIHCITSGADIAEETNLCVRAARLLQSATGASHGVTIQLTKRIPIGAGLGGGSADAAATLRGLNILWGLRLSDADLRQLAAQLGSDVPFFILGGTALGTGRGEILEPLELSIPYWIVVCIPQVHVSTAWAYSQVSPARERNITSVGTFRRDGIFDFTMLQNDFEPVVFRAYPEIAALKEELLRRGAVCALMSGSGSSVFGLFSDEQQARRAERELSRSYTVSLTEPFFKPEPLFILH